MVSRNAKARRKFLHAALCRNAGSRARCHRANACRNGSRGIAGQPGPGLRPPPYHRRAAPAQSGSRCRQTCHMDCRLAAARVRRQDGPRSRGQWSSPGRTGLPGIISSGIRGLTASPAPPRSGNTSRVALACRRASPRRFEPSGFQCRAAPSVRPSTAPPAPAATRRPRPLRGGFVDLAVSAVDGLR